MKKFVIIIFFGISACKTATHKPSDEAYIVEQITMPKGLLGQAGGIDFMPDGRLVACFMRGEVMTYNTKTKEWRLFAEGLMLPLGIHAVSDSEVLVMQTPNLVRIKDTDGDGIADLYENAADDYGISGNYHEFNYGVVQDTSGNVFFSLNCGSSGGGIRPIVRGELNIRGRDGIDGHKEMFSVVPYRGWVMMLSPDGKLHPFASGFRSPNGLGFDTDGNLFVTDNQSDWVPTGSLFHVQQNKFYGHPASLVWTNEWKNRDPFNAGVSELDSMRTRASVLFPQGIIANSPSQPLADATKGKFGPFAGQLFIGEINRDRIVRVMLEKVDGEFQGACIPFIDGHGLHPGNNRLAFDADGNLWVGQIGFGGWLPDSTSGIQKIRYTGRVPMDVYTMRLTSTGFDLTFTKEPDKNSALNTANYKMRRYRYEYKKKDINEGIDDAPQVGVKEVSVTSVNLSNDRKSVSLSLSDLQPGFIYELTLGEIKSTDDQLLNNKIICYTLNKLQR
jgi:glucose/arabinose dehydrogenase